MKKLFIILGVAIVAIIFLLIENSHLKNESSAFEKKLEAVKNSNETLHIDSGDSAKNFISNYFNYKKKPNRKKVESYATKEALEKLQFEKSEGVEENYGGAIEPVQSEVSNVHIYYGESSKDRQKVVGVFENTIKVNGRTSSANTIMELHMVISEGKWKVNDLTFSQY